MGKLTPTHHHYHGWPEDTWANQKKKKNRTSTIRILTNKRGARLVIEMDLLFWVQAHFWGQNRTNEFVTIWSPALSCESALTMVLTVIVPAWSLHGMCSDTSSNFGSDLSSDPDLFGFWPTFWLRVLTTSSGVDSVACFHLLLSIRRDIRAADVTDSFHQLVSEPQHAPTPHQDSGTTTLLRHIRDDWFLARTYARLCRTKSTRVRVQFSSLLRAPLSEKCFSSCGLRKGQDWHGKRKLEYSETAVNTSKNQKQWPKRVEPGLMRWVALGAIPDCLESNNSLLWTFSEREQVRPPLILARTVRVHEPKTSAHFKYWSNLTGSNDPVGSFVPTCLGSCYSTKLWVTKAMVSSTCYHCRSCQDHRCSTKLSKIKNRQCLLLIRIIRKTMFDLNWWKLAENRWGLLVGKTTTLWNHFRATWPFLWLADL